MSSVQKTPLTRTLNRFATKRAVEVIQRLGRSLPGTVLSVSGSIVTVNLEVKGETLDQVTMPVFGPEYIRYPIQKGGKGVCFPVDTFIGNVSGLGSGTPDDTLQGNLSTLIWFPVGNKNWPAVDPEALTLYGPTGVVIRDTASESVMTLTPADVEFDSAVVSTTENLVAGTGASGTFTTPTGQTVTVQDGIIVNIF